MVEFWLQGIADWTYEIYFFLISYTILLYFLCALLFPDNVDEYGGYEEYFLSRRKWFLACWESPSSSISSTRC